MNLFTIAPNDASVQYLADIFGSMNGVLLVGANANNTTYGTNILGAMFKTFNATVLVIAALMLIYVTVVGVMQTAHEGEFMGKKWNNIWIPIRSVLGIVLLVPTYSGYSVLQVIMMWVIVQGIGAADTVWNTAIKYVEVMGSVYAQASVPSPELNTALSGLFQGLVCDATARISTADPTNTKGGQYYCAKNPTDSFCGSSAPEINPNTPILNLGPGSIPGIPGSGSCGTLGYCYQTGPASACVTKPDSIDCAACKAQVTALQAVVQTLGGIAAEVAAADLSYRTFYASAGGTTNQASGTQWMNDYCSSQNPPIPQNRCCVKSGSPFVNCKVGTPFPKTNGSNAQDPSSDAVQTYWKYYPALGPSLGQDNDFIATATTYMMDAINGVYNTYISNQANSGEGSVFGVDAKKGWIFAGGYYWNLANNNTKSMSAAIPNIEWKLPQDFGSGKMSKYRNNYAAAETLISAAQGVEGGNKFKKLASKTANDIRAAFKTAIEDKGSNPLLAMQIVGAYLLLLAQGLFLLLIVIITTIGITGFVSFWLFGTGILNPIGPLGQLLAIFLIPALYAFFGYLIVLGGLLAIYIPLIPYIVFTFGAIAWLISVIVALVAAPLVALGIISPSGQHELLGKAEPALMLLFGIFLRPVLMIFGLIAAMLLSYVVMKMINTIFWPVVFPTVGLMGALFSMILALAAYVGLVVAALNKTFSLINVVPQQVMSWIGGHAEAVETPLEQIKASVDKAGGEIKDSGQSAKAAMQSEQKKQKQKPNTSLSGGS